MRQVSTLAAIGITAALVTALAACSSDSDGAGGARRSGDTIKLMVIGELSSPVMSLPQLVVGGQAGANEVNAGGGVNGHKIELLSCNTQADPNVAATCARKAVSEKVSAVVGMLTVQSNSVQSILAAAKIPTIANAAFNALDYTSPNSFPATASPVANVGMALTMPGYQDCKHPAFLAMNNPAAQDGGNRVKNVYAKLNLDLKIVNVNPDAGDIRPQVATLLSGGSDCVHASVTPSIALSLIKNVADSGQKVKLSLMMTTTPLESLRQLGAAAQGVYASSPFQEPGTSDAADKFATAMTAVDPEAIQDSSAQGAYTGVLIFARAAESLTDFSAPKVLDALTNAKNIDAGTIAPIPSFRADGGVPGAPRINVTSLYSYVFEGNDFKLVTPNPVDIRPGL